MRLVFLALAIACAALGILFGALNPQAVSVDFYAMSVSASLGAALLVAAFAGALFGGLAIVIGVVWPLQRRLARTRRQQAKAPAPVQPSPDVVPSSSTDLMVLPADRP
jgi:lipopolysaccharide assembly protein A